MRDLNSVIGQGKNWRLPVFWAPLLRWLAAPVLIYILGFSYSEFKAKWRDPLHIFAFALSHVGVTIVVLGFISPDAFAFLIPKTERDADQRQYAVQAAENLPVEDQPHAFATAEMEG